VANSGGPSSPALGPFEPTDHELRISARIVFHIATQPRLGSKEPAPETLTQAGIALATKATQAAVAHALRRLIHGGLVKAERRHVHGRGQQVYAYQLTEDGESLASHIRTSMAMLAASQGAE